MYTTQMQNPVHESTVSIGLGLMSKLEYIRVLSSAHFYLSSSWKQYHVISGWLSFWVHKRCSNIKDPLKPNIDFKWKMCIGVLLNATIPRHRPCWNQWWRNRKSQVFLLPRWLHWTTLWMFRCKNCRNKTDINKVQRTLANFRLPYP